MRAASRETYATAAAKLDGIARTSDSTALATIGDELLAVARLLGREPRLRRALADPGRAAADRVTLIDGLVANSVGTETRDILGAVAAGRWSSAVELLDGVELLGIDALLAGAGRSGDLGEVEDELFRFGQVVDGSPELAVIASDTTVDLARREALINGLLAGKAKPTTVRLATLALASFGGRTFTGALTRLVELVADERDKQVAYVTVATPLTDDEESHLGTRLAAMYGRDITLKITVDPGILGGVRVLVGSDLYDGTIMRRLSDTRHVLTSK